MKLLKKIGLASLLLILISFSSESSVYVCDSSTSVAYHSSSDCRGLNKCTHTIIRVSQNDAINKYGKRACKICY